MVIEVCMTGNSCSYIVLFDCNMVVTTLLTRFKFTGAFSYNWSSRYIKCSCLSGFMWTFPLIETIFMRVLFENIGDRIPKLICLMAGHCYACFS